MQIFIEIEETENRLKLLKEYKPIVCGNTNYAIKFTFDEEWAACNKKTAWFVVEGKNIPVEFEGEICPIPAMPNQNMFFVFLIASKNENESLTTTSIHLILEKNPAVDRLKKIEPFKSYYAKLLGAINNVEAGNFKIAYAESAGRAKIADSATDAQMAEFAENSNHSKSADVSLSSDEALHAQSSDESTHAVSADSATISSESTHAMAADVSTRSNEALHAEQANEATHAVTAERSTIAEKSSTQVSLTGDQIISGVKNFTGELQLNGESLMNFRGFSNPNLLINGDFKINQRFATTYSAVGDYTVDRWKLTSGTVTVSSGGIVLNGTITQPFENEVSAPYSISVDKSHGEVSASFDGKVFSLSAKNVLIGWAKLEQGSVVTPFVPNDYATEMKACQRYFLNYDFAGESLPFLGMSNGTYIFFHIALPEPMRAQPTIISTNTGLYFGNGIMEINLADVFAFDRFGKLCVVRLQGVSPTEVGKIYYWQIRPGGFIYIDAEIY